ncbi:Craniofacial development protein 2 [Eumeta japonica]|uniref:Craniofacial development protein 2 n=1 Tax=Eumeta variegata TaxID=151549 RepID=A0A4C1Z468_EUMVA|nr:Craniofacial development protein 2 [Eumeta japonica]
MKIEREKGNYANIRYDKLIIRHNNADASECLKNINFDVIGLVEIRKLGNTIEEHDEFIFYYIEETPGLYGVGFIVKKYLKRYITSFTGLSERVALLRINVNSLELIIIQVYAPTEASSDEELEFFYSTVDKAIQLSDNIIIVMGDFNAKIGQTNPNEPATGRHGYGDRNCRGKRLIDFAHENNFVIMNTFFKKNNKQRWTWRSPNDVIFHASDPLRSSAFGGVSTLHGSSACAMAEHDLLCRSNCMPTFSTCYPSSSECTEHLYRAPPSSARTRALPVLNHERLVFVIN